MFSADGRGPRSREGTFGIHSEDKLLGRKPTINRNMRIFGDRGDSLQKRTITHGRVPLLFFSQLP